MWLILIIKPPPAFLLMGKHVEKCCCILLINLLLSVESVLMLCWRTVSPAYNSHLVSVQQFGNSLTYKENNRFSKSNSYTEEQFTRRRRSVASFFRSRKKREGGICILSCCFFLRFHKTLYAINKARAWWLGCHGAKLRRTYLLQLAL